MSWIFKTLDELGKVARGKSKHRPRNDKKLFGGLYPFIQTADVKKANFYISEYSETYNETGLAQSKLWDAGTLCITIAANIADTGILSMPACFPDSIMGFIPYDGISDVRFIKYCFDILQMKCKQISQGTAQDNLSWEKLSTIKFPAPPLKTQCRIAEILSRYDTLIENYQKQIKLLEESAQRLYKEWFVDLRFPGYENTKIVDGVPEGWEKKCLGDFCLIFTGKKNANSNIKNGKYKFFTCGDKPLSINSYIYDGAAIIISGNGSYTGRTTFFKGKFDLYQRTYACTIKSGFNNNYIYGLYEFVNSELTSQISGGTHGAAIPYIVMSDLTGFTFLYNEYVLLKFSSIIKKNLLETIKIIDRIQLLTEARDRLLPKLMGGEIEV